MPGVRYISYIHTYIVVQLESMVMVVNKKASYMYIWLQGIYELR